MTYYENNHLLNETGNFELWQTDGTEEGTRLAAEIVAGSEGSYPEEITVSGDKLYFTAHHPDNGRELWTLDISTGLQKQKIEKVLRVYPNPASNQLNIDGLRCETTYVLDITGYIIRSFSKKTNNQILDIPGLSPGIYFVRNGEKSAKFVKY